MDAEQILRYTWFDRGHHQYGYSELRTRLSTEMPTIDSTPNPSLDAYVNETRDIAGELILPIVDVRLCFDLHREADSSSLSSRQS